MSKEHNSGLEDEQGSHDKVQTPTVSDFTAYLPYALQHMNVNVPVNIIRLDSKSAQYNFLNKLISGAWVTPARFK